MYLPEWSEQHLTGFTETIHDGSECERGKRRDPPGHKSLDAMLPYSHDARAYNVKLVDEIFAAAPTLAVAAAAVELR